MEASTNRIATKDLITSARDPKRDFARVVVVGGLGVLCFVTIVPDAEQPEFSKHDIYVKPYAGHAEVHPEPASTSRVSSVTDQIRIAATGTYTGTYATKLFKI